MGKIITRVSAFAGKNQHALFAEEIDVTTAVPHFGKIRVEDMAGTTPNGASTYKSQGYIIGGSISESREIEDSPADGHRNIQQFSETKFSASGSLNLSYQTGRPFYYALSAFQPGATGLTAAAAGVIHYGTTGVAGPPTQTADGSLPAGLYRHIFYEPEWIATGSTGTTTDNIDCIPDIPSFNLIDGYSMVAAAQKKIIRRYVGAKVNTLGINLDKSGFMKLDLDWMGAAAFASQTTNNSTAYMPVTDQILYEDVYPHVFGKVYLADWTMPTGSTLPSWDAAQDTALANSTNRLTNLNTIKITLDNSLEASFVHGDKIAAAINPVSRKWSGTIETQFTDEQQHVDFLGTLGVAPPVNTYSDDPSSVATSTGTGNWAYPWYVSDRMKYKQLKVFYDNSSLGYDTSSASYRRFEATLLGVKFKSLATPRTVAGIITQSIEWSALMLAPFNSTGMVGGITVYDGMSAADFHSTATGIGTSAYG